MDHKAIIRQNQIAWNSHAYEAWVCAHGTPQEAAQKLLPDPEHKLRRILPHIDSVQGKSIANPLGSHGRIAVALALLGADVSVFDLSAASKRYADELAHSANVKINYHVGDFIELASQHVGQFDSAIMELGILHYFNELDVFTRALSTILKPKGCIVLNEFHPLQKAIEFNADGIRLSGDYFSTHVESANTPYDRFLTNTEVPQCAIRRWSLGDVITSFVENGFQINKLIETPAVENAQLPGTYTLVATLA